MTEPNHNLRDIILVPIDFSDVSEFAIDHAIEIAKIFKHKIYLLHVFNRRAGGSASRVLAQEELESKARAITTWTGLEVQAGIVEGSILHTINDVAESIQAEFVVMGVHGMKGVEHLVGSYAYKIVASSRIPVLVVKHMHHHVGYKDIVLPVNFSQKRAHKIHQALRFAKYFGATVRIFGFLSSENPAKIIKKEALLKGTTDIFKKHGIPVTTELLVNPGFDWVEALVGYSDKIGADLIMIVADKADRMHDMLYANKTERIIEKADMPILTVAPIEEAPVEPDARKKAFFKPFLDPLGLMTADFSDDEDENPNE